MSFILRKCARDPVFFEIVEGDQVVREIPVAFSLFKWPRHFASVSEIERWIGEEERKLAKKIAYRCLAARNQSASELRKKLSRRGISPPVAEAVVEELKRLGYISDADFEQALIERELRRGHGPLYIEMKLRSMGLGTAQVRKIATDQMQRQMIRKIVSKLRNPAAALRRRGFDAEIIFSELKDSFFNV
jgi:regulatory protein